MAAVSTTRSRFLPALYPLLALIVGALLLPSALRPPPEQTSDSAALNPNAPPDEQQEQIVQSLKQASGGAGQSVDESATTTTTEPEREASKGSCFAGRQIESVYSAKCAPAFKGSNGGATGHNVFANEIKLGFWHNAGQPPEGPLDEGNMTSSSKRTFKFLQDYVNKRFETYGRKVRFVGLNGSSDAAANQALARKADSEQRIFAASHLDRQFCLTFARIAGPVFCNPSPASVYETNRPNYYSFMMDRTLAAGFGAEFVCKKLHNRVATFSGTENGRMRKISILSEDGPSQGMPPAVYQEALRKECGATYGGKSYQFDGGNDPKGITSALLQMQASGVTTVVVELNAVNALLTFYAADTIGFQPEWVIISAFGIDFNTSGTVLPPTQSAHIMGLSAWEVPQRFEQTECYQAYKEMDVDNEPDEGTCRLFWHQIVLMLSAIQNAGPRLDAKAFEKGLFQLGHRFPPEPWAVGGGFGPGDYSYMDNVGEIWFSLGAQNPENGAPGAYVWTYGAQRWKRGEIPNDGGVQLFKRGVTTPGAADEGD